MFRAWAPISTLKRLFFHMPWLRQLIQSANIWCLENFLQRHVGTSFWFVLPGNAITPLVLQACVGKSSNVQWTVVTLFPPRKALVLIELVSFKRNWWRPFQSVVNLPLIVWRERKRKTSCVFAGSDWQCFGKIKLLLFCAVLNSWLCLWCATAWLCHLFICLLRLDSSVLVLLFLLCL